MKRAITTLMFLLVLTAMSAQKLNKKLNLYLKASPMYFVAGASDGINQVLWARYDHFKRIHPNANDQYWNPFLSWENKYDHGLLKQTAFVWLTDGHHMTRTVSRTAIRYNNLFHPVVIPDQKWYWYLIDFTYLFLAESIGFHSTWSGIYR